MLQDYDHIIAIDYAERNIAIARLTRKAKKPQVIEGCYAVKDLREYLKSLHGTKHLTIEETTTAQWLYCELRGYVDHMAICDPFHNKLLCSGAKNDRIDAAKLAMLARAGLLKEVYHSTDKLINLRRLVSSYQDVVVAGVRLKNQKSALYRQAGKSYRASEPLEEPHTAFILERLNRGIEEYEEVKDEYISEFKKARRSDKRIKRLCKVPGIDVINAVRVLAMVIDARRFKKAGKYLAYCGLVLHCKDSGKRSYGKRRPRYCRVLKNVYKTAALAMMRGSSDMSEYYYMLLDRGVAEHNARHSMARQIAVATYGMLKHDTEYKPYLWRNYIEQKPKPIRVP